VPRQRWLAGLGATATLAGLTIVSFTGSAGAAPAPHFTRLAGSAPSFTRTSPAIGAVSAGTRLSVQVWLKPDLTAAERYVAAATTPGSAQFGHYLSPDAYTARFGATRSATAKVEAWMRSQGFTAVGADAQRDYVRGTAPAKTIDAAFKVRLENYRATAQASASPYTLHSNSGPVEIPSALSAAVLGVTGLDNAKPELPLETPGAKPASPLAKKDLPLASKRPSEPCSGYYGQVIARNFPKHFGVRNFPTEVCGYTANQLRAAYEINKTSTGKGQKVALIELGLTQDMFTTLADYAHAAGLPKPSSSRYAELSLGRGTQCGDEFDVEEQLDVEASYAMAPSVSQLVVGGDSCNNGDFGLQGLFNADLAVINGNGHHPLASIASNSWEGNTEEQPASLTSIETGYLVRAAAQGVGMYFSAGDGSGVLSPSDNPYAIAVGGTTLGIGKHYNRLFETGWSTGESFLLGSSGWVFVGEQGATGGGASLLWAEPSYQKGVAPPALVKPQGNRGGTVRSAPDISADADPFTGMRIGVLEFFANKPPEYVQSDIGGTSEASPLIAGIVADAQQGQPRAFGFVDAALYRMYGTAAYHDTLPINGHSNPFYRGVACEAFTCGIQVLTTFDDQSRNMFGYEDQVTLKGFDNMTGVGTPRGQAFIRELRRIEG
jgi:subtilase family serine protease